MVTIATSDNVMCISSLWKVFVLVYTCSMVKGETVSETVVASIDWFEDAKISQEAHSEWNRQSNATRPKNIKKCY